MEELTLAKKKAIKKNSGTGAGPLPLRRRYVRERIEQTTRGGKDMGTTDAERLRHYEEGGGLEELNSRIQKLSWEDMDGRVERRMRRTGETDYATALRQEVAESPELHHLPDASIRRSGEPHGDAAGLARAAEERMRLDPEGYRDR